MSKWKTSASSGFPEKLDSNLPLKTSISLVEVRYKDDGTIDQFFSKLAIEDSKTRERLYSCLTEQPQLRLSHLHFTRNTADCISTTAT